MDSTNPYQPAHLDPRSRRRSLVIIFSAGVGSILALILLNVVARPPRSAPIIDVELAPAAAVADIETTTLAPAAPVFAPATTVSESTVPTSTVPPSTVPPTTAPVTRSGPPRWFPPDTPDFVRAEVRDDESLDVVAPYAGGTMAYFAVTSRGSAACGGAVYRIEQGHGRELVSSARYLFPRGDGRWVVLSSNQGSECRPTTLTIIDTFNNTSREVPAAGWFAKWSPIAPRFILFDYLIVQFTLYDAPSATWLRVGVSSPFAAELASRTATRLEQPGWVMGQVAFLADGDLVAHIQCLPDACPKKDAITGWFYVVDGQVTGEEARVPADKAPPVSSYCGV